MFMLGLELLFWVIGTVILIKHIGDFMNKK